MTHADILLTFAEIGIGLAGFTGVVATFGHRGRLSPLDVFRFLSAFAIAIFLTVASLLPVGLHHMGLGETMVWRIGSLLGVGYVAVGSPIFYRFGRRLGPAFRQARIPATSWVVEYSGRLFLVISLSNAIGWPFRPNFATFFASLVLAFVVAAITFAMIVVYRPDHESGSRSTPDEPASVDTKHQRGEGPPAG